MVKVDIEDVIEFLQENAEEFTEFVETYDDAYATNSVSRICKALAEKFLKKVECCGCENLDWEHGMCLKFPRRRNLMICDERYCAKYR